MDRISRRTRNGRSKPWNRSRLTSRRPTSTTCTTGWPAPAGPTSCPASAGTYGVPLALPAGAGRVLAHRLRLARARGRAQRVPAVHHRDRRPEHPLPARPLARAGRAAADPHPRLARLGRRVPRRHRPADRPARPRRRPGRRVPPGDPVDPRLRLLRPDRRDRLGRRAGSPRAWAELMRRLGYERYGAQGGDCGSVHLPRARPRSHPSTSSACTSTAHRPSRRGDPAELDGLTESDQARLEQAAPSSTPSCPAT